MAKNKEKSKKKRNDWDADEILPRLYLGDYSSTHDKEALSNRHITHILNVTEECPFAYPKDFTHKRIRATDDFKFDLLAHFDEAHQYIDRALSTHCWHHSHTKEERNSGPTGAILVHCAAGMSRSAAVVISYVMKFKKMSSRESFKFVRHCRGIVQPNERFMYQLQLYQEMKCSIKGDSTGHLRYNSFKIQLKQDIKQWKEEEKKKLQMEAKQLEDEQREQKMLAKANKGKKTPTKKGRLKEKDSSQKKQKHGVSGATTTKEPFDEEPIKPVEGCCIIS